MSSPAIASFWPRQKVARRLGSVAPAPPGLPHPEAQLRLGGVRIDVDELDRTDQFPRLLERDREVERGALPEGEDLTRDPRLGRVDRVGMVNRQRRIRDLAHARKVLHGFGVLREKRSQAESLRLERRLVMAHPRSIPPTGPEPAPRDG